MINLFTFFDFNESSSCTTNIFQIEKAILEFYLGMIARDALVKYKNLI